MSFHAGEKQVVLGITQELIDCLIKAKASPGHVIDPTKFTPTITPFDQESLKYELEAMLLESNVTMLYHTQVAAVNMDGEKIRSLTVANKGGLNQITAKVYVDATGDADLVAFSGNPYTKGRPGDGKAIPMTLVAKFENVDIDRFKQFLRDSPESWYGSKTIEASLSSVVLSGSGLIKEFNIAKARGEIDIPREDVLFFQSPNPGEIHFNTTRIINHDSSDPWSFSEAESIGRKQTHQLLLFLKKYIPGFENCWMSLTGPVVGSRSSRQLDGAYKLTVDDIMNLKYFDDAIAFSAYPIDVHNPDGEGTKKYTFLGARSIAFLTGAPHRN